MEYSVKENEQSKGEEAKNSGIDDSIHHQNASISQQVAEHYNARMELGKRKRAESRVFHLKNFNNWIKSVLISTYCRRGYAVCDLAGGKGGDLLKYTVAKISYYMLIDIAQNSVKDALARFNEKKYVPFAASFAVADCFKPKLFDNISKDVTFDLVSIQFALHYSFESEQQVRGLLSNVAERLQPGGYFIGTIPDSEWILKKARSSKDSSFGNDIYKIAFEADCNNPPTFGAKYYFTLEDSVENCPEFLVSFPTLEKIAAEYGLVRRLKKGFKQFYEENITVEQHKQLFWRMKVPNEKGTLSDEEWEVADLYLVFAFQKEGQASRDYHRTKHKPSRLSEKDIIIIE